MADGHAAAHDGVDPGAVYFTEDAYGTIARLERQAAAH